MSRLPPPRAANSGPDEPAFPPARRVTQSPAVARREADTPSSAPVAASVVAACIARHARERGEASRLDPQRVHDLLFLCQGYSLATHGRPLFTGRLLASPGGVSCPDAPEPHDDPHAGDGPEELRSVVAHVWEKFGGMSPPNLQTRVRSHVWCVQEMAGGGPDLSADAEAMEMAFRLAVRQGLI